MAITLDLPLVREQCRIVDEISDALLQSYVDAALAHVQMHCDRTLVEGEPSGEGEMALTADVRQAVLLMVGNWAENRSAVGELTSEIALGVSRLLWYRKRF
ncbi:MAG: head-tail connector protein [Stenotrophomonas indicatrix]|uniref:head-tail connector protein n=1 Tax=Stenotrophomonas indicatrix TaxID=2045451 RepID=UPI003D0E8BE6